MTYATLSHAGARDEEGNDVLFGLTATQLALAAAAGAGVGVLAAGGNSLLTAGAGTLVVIYVAHLVVEVVAIGGALYLWPDSEVEPAPQAGPEIKFRRHLIQGQLRMSTSMDDAGTPRVEAGLMTGPAPSGP